MEKTTMPRKTPIGRIDALGDGRFQWTIDDFLSEVPIGERQTSPDFNFLNGSCNIYWTLTRHEWFLFLYANSSCPRRLHVEVRMVTGGISGTSDTHTGVTGESGQFGTVMLFHNLESDWISLLFLPKGRLTLSCNFRSLDTGEIASASSERLPGSDKVAGENKPSESDSDEDESITQRKIFQKMQEDFKNLLTSGEDTDVIIKVQGKEFPAIRGILRARSPVFKSMFSHDMVEKQKGVVVIDDCDPDAFPDFLNYVYTGSTKHISLENVFSLYTVSDKYGVEELKEQCAAFMKCNVSVGTFCDIVTLALRHTEKELLGLATGFFCANATEILKTVKWQIFLKENLTVGNELLIKALSNGKNI